MDICNRHKLFEGHSKLELAQVLSKAHAVKMRAGSTLFSFGDKGTSLFILQSGELTCLARNGTEVKVLKAGIT